MNPNRSDRPRPAPGGQQGFVLVAVLVALVVLTLLATAIATTSERAVQEARENSDAFEAEVAMTSTRDTLLFMFNTQRRTYGCLTIDKQVSWSAGEATASRASADEDSGLPPMLPIGNEIRFDGTPYQGLNGVRFALRDDGGRFSPNWTFDLYRPGFYGQLGVTAEQLPELEAKRLDYQDPDNLFRLGGAEAEDYRRKDLPPPTNRPLATPLELRRVMGWGQALQGLDDAQVVSRLTTARNVMVNVNSAPPAVLQALPGVDKDVAQRIVGMRQTMPFMLPWQFLDTYELPLDELAPISMLATSSGTLQLWHNAGGPIRSVHWTLTPGNEGGRPWRLDYTLVLPRDPASDQTPARTIPTPLFADPGTVER